MPSPTRPNTYPLWTQGNNAVRQQPTNGEQFTGFVANFRPPSGWHNWLFGIVSDWISWLDYATQGNGPVSNVGHNIMLGTTVQQQLDEADAFLSSMGITPIVMTVTGNPLVYTLASRPINDVAPMVFIDGQAQYLTDDFTYAVVFGVGTVTFATAPASPNVRAYGLTAVSPGSGGSSATGGYVVYGAYNGGVPITAGGGITSTADQRAIIFTVSGAGGVVPITANPQISAGTKVGQELKIVGTSDTNYIILANGNGLILTGPISLQNAVSIDFWWNGSVWVESDRSN